MATTLPLPPDFSDFLRLLEEKGVEYLLVGGYAVGYHGYPRATADLDIWVAISEVNACRIVEALRDFGFDLPELQPQLFLQEDRIVRLGHPPLRIKLMTSASGVEFSACHARRVIDTLGSVRVSILSLADLKANKRAAGRHKDLDDLENLP